RGAAAVHRWGAARGDRGRRDAVGAGTARRLEHPREGHARRAHLPHARRHHPAARPPARAAAAARARDRRHDRHAHAPLRRRDRRRGPPDAPRPHLPRARPALPLAGRGHRPRRRVAVRPLLRARRAGAPGDGVARLDREDAGAVAAADEPGAVAHRARRRGRRGRARRHRVGGRVSTAPEPATAAAPSPEPPSLEVRGLAFAYPDGHQALYGIDLTVRRGERVALLGPNGAGKTTLVLHLNGILTPGRGSVVVGGLPVEKQHLREIRRRVGIVFQDPDDQLFLPTVGEDVAFGPANFGVSGAELEARVEAALAAVGMSEHRDRSPLHLSGGQRRRVALATVLACEPEILVLDEPSTNLDPVARRELAEVLLGLDTTMLM